MVLRRMLLVVVLLVGTLLSTVAVAQAGVSSQLPPACPATGGRNAVTPIVGAHHSVHVTSTWVTCTKPVTGVVSYFRLMRYWASTKVWSVEHEIVYRSVESAVNSHGTPGVDFHWYCRTAGALMGLQVQNRFYVGATRVADVTHSQRSTAICPAGDPQPPLGCKDNPGTNGVSPIVGAHHAVRVSAAGDTCPYIPTTVDTVTSNVQLLRYWVSSKTWTVERQVLYTGTTGAPAVDVAFFCSTPGALMGMRVVDHFYHNGIRIIPFGAPLAFSDVTYNGSSTAICPR